MQGDKRAGRREREVIAEAAGRILPRTRVAEQPLHRALGLTDWELQRIQELMGRAPNHFELAVFSLLWSEHCGYKHSALLLKRLPSAGERVLQGPGENAGVIDLGDGEAVAFKVESHNHPSAVEPFQGAATGVGGILRDIVAMGARPVALLDGLRFGAPDHAFRRAVAGIGAYGNSVGLPTVGGEAVFDEAYTGNCIVNAMCVGLLPSERVTRARARGTGNPIVLYGATTGRDGIGGASVLASQEVGEGSARLLTDECPRYEVDRLPTERAPAPVDPVNHEPKRWIYEQYDHLVQSRTVRRPGLDAAVLRLRPSWRGLAASLDGPPLGERDPRAAGREAVLDAARNVACAGGEPLALTDCLNFGNPEKPEIGWELAEAIEGIAEAAEALGIPVVSGNVSLYNETGGRAIPPTPVVGCVGLLPDVRAVPRGWRPGDRAWLAEGDPVELIAWLWRNASRLSLAHDVSDGGLAVALEEASRFSGHDFRADGDAPYGSVVLAGERPNWPHLRELGTVA